MIFELENETKIKNYFDALSENCCLYADEPSPIAFARRLLLIA